MKWLIAVALLGVVSAAPAFNNNEISPAMRGVLLDMLKNMMNSQGFKVGSKPPVPVPPPKPFAPSPPAFLPPPPPKGGASVFIPPPPNQGKPAFLPPFPPRRPGGRGPNGGPRPGGRFPANGLLMDMPNNSGGGFGRPPMMGGTFCPPGPTSSDTCKDQKLFAALYYPDGTPRYNWVPPRNPWDSSISDNVKDTAQNILLMKVNQRANRTPTAQEYELMSLLGDPKDGVRNPFAMAG